MCLGLCCMRHPHLLYPTALQVPTCSCFDKCLFAKQSCIKVSEASWLCHCTRGEISGGKQESQLCCSGFFSSFNLQILVFLRSIHWKGNGRVWLMLFLASIKLLNDCLRCYLPGSQNLLWLYSLLSCFSSPFSVMLLSYSLTLRLNSTGFRHMSN